MAWIYMVRCNDGSLYTGSTEKDPDVRVWEHNNDDYLAARHTMRRRPVLLVYTEHFESIADAAAREKQLHGWSRLKKLALIDGRLDDLRALARCSTDRP